MTAPASEITVAREDAALTLTIDRPDRLNSVTPSVLEDLADLIEEAGADEAVRVIVLTGAGRAFSAGADLKRDRTPPPGSDEPVGLDTIRGANRVVRALRDVPQPTIAAVNGACVGVGVSLALGCDLVIVSDAAYFLLPFTNIGLLPDGGATALVPINVGRATAMGWALAPERIPAAEALAQGLVTRVVAAAELDATVKALTARLADGAALALTATKRAINAATLGPLDAAHEREHDSQALLLRSADFAEAVAAFGERRPPRFTGH